MSVGLKSSSGKGDHSGQKPVVYIYGTGWGSIIAELLVEQGFKIAGMWSYDLEELARLKERLSIEYTTGDKDELLSYQNTRRNPSRSSGSSSGSTSGSSSIVWIATPPFQLAYIAKEILTLSNNIVVETPGASSVAEAEKLYNGASQFATWLCTCPYQLRYLPDVIRMRDIIMEQSCGLVTSVEVRLHCNMTKVCGTRYNWKYDKNQCGGALSMYGCHIIDILNYLLNEDVDSVYGSQECLVRQNDHVNGIRSITADTVCNFDLKYKASKKKFLNDSIFAWVHINMCYPDTVFEQRITVLTTECALTLDNSTLSINPFEGYPQHADLVGTLTRHEQPLFDCPELEPGQPAPYILGMKHFIAKLPSFIAKLPSRLPAPSEETGPKTGLDSLQHIMKVMELIRESSEKKTRLFVIEKKYAVSSKKTTGGKSTSSVRSSKKS